MDNELISKLFSKIETLENENVELRTRLDKLYSINKMIFESNGFEFNINYFLMNQSIEYLKMFDLSDGALYEICMKIDCIGFPCMKYLIDSHLDGTYDWDKNPHHKKKYSCCTPFLINIFHHGNKENILYLLDKCIEKDFIKVLVYVEYYGHRQSIHKIMCYSKDAEIVKRILNIYYVHGLDLECKTDDGFTPLMLVCKYGTMQTIKCCIDFFVEKGLHLESKSEYMVNRLEYFLRSNTNPLVNTVGYKYLNSVEYTEFCTV